MSAVSTAPARPLPRPSRAPLGRLARVELRKMTDTRSGFWLLLATVALTLLVVVIAGFTGADASHSFEQLAGISLFPMGIFLPILGILSMTAEFSQRTALTTFTAVPQRERIVLAKALAALVLGLAGLVAGLLFAAVVTAFAPGGGDYGFGVDSLGMALLFAELQVLIGLGFGMLFGSPAVAIVVYFVAPTVFSVVGGLVDALRDPFEWLDTSQAYEPLSDFTAHGEEWARILTSSLLWVGVPLLLGLWLLRRREVS